MIEEKQLAISFNIVLSEDVQNKLKEVQKMLAEHITERRHYDSSPHLAICTKFMPQSKVEEYTEVINRTFNNLQTFTIKFTKLEPTTSGKYIFLNLETKSREYILELNTKTRAATKGIGNETIDGLPTRYPFDPHISIIKLEPHETQKALDLLDQIELAPMLIQQLEVSVESRDENGYATFPIKLVLNLNSAI